MLEQRIESGSPLMRDLVQKGIDNADAQLSELANDTMTQSYFAELGSEVVNATRELEEVRPVLASLGMEAELAEKEAELHARAADPKVRAAMLCLQLAGIVETVPSPTHNAVNAHEVTSAPKPAEPETPAVQPEQDSDVVQVLVGTNYNLKVGGKYMSLGVNRETAPLLGIADNDARRIRFRIIKFLSQHPGDRFSRGAILSAIGEDITSRNHWETVREIFYDDSLAYKGTPLVSVIKTSDRLHHFEWTGPEIKLTELDREIKSKDDTVFTLSNGVETSGLRGKVLHRLVRASEDNLFWQKDFEELITNPEATQLSSTVSSIRAVLEKNGSEFIIKRLQTGHKSADRTNTYPGYYAVKNPDFDLEAVIAQAESAPEAPFESPFKGPKITGEEITIYLEQTDQLDNPEEHQDVTGAYDDSQKKVIVRATIDKIVEKSIENLEDLQEMCTMAVDMKLPAGKVLSEVLDELEAGGIDDLLARFQ